MENPHSSQEDHGGEIESLQSRELFESRENVERELATTRESREQEQLAFLQGQERDLESVRRLEAAFGREMPDLRVKLQLEGEEWSSATEGRLQRELSLQSRVDAPAIDSGKGDVYKDLMETDPEFRKRQEKHAQESRAGSLQPEVVAPSEALRRGSQEVRSAQASPPIFVEAGVPDANVERGLVQRHELSEVFERAGIESRIVKVNGNDEFPEIVILEKKEKSSEKCIRLYRGVNHLDASILEQIPYAMRTVKDGVREPMALESVRREVDALVKEPTYEHLLAYVKKVRPSVTAEEVRRLDGDLARIEDRILEGSSIRKELAFEQIRHNGGSVDAGIAPYISASSNPHEASTYGDGGLMVIDVPLSEIQDFGLNNTEISLKGALDPKYITAIMPRRRSGFEKTGESDRQLDEAIQRVYEQASGSLYSDEELSSERERKLLEESQADQARWGVDADAVRQKRSRDLVARFPEAGLNVEGGTEEGVDVYMKTKRGIFDYYRDRLERIGKAGQTIDAYEYQEEGFDGRKKFDREKPTEDMLLKLKKLVLRLEQAEEDRRA